MKNRIHKLEVVLHELLHLLFASIFFFKVKILSYSLVKQTGNTVWGDVKFTVKDASKLSSIAGIMTSAAPVLGYILVISLFFTSESILVKSLVFIFTCIIDIKSFWLSDQDIKTIKFFIKNWNSNTLHTTNAPQEAAVDENDKEIEDKGTEEHDEDELMDLLKKENLI